jgi:hypothetical protein
MDHGNAQSTFIEITFGVNTLFAVYYEFHRRLEKNLRRRVDEFEGQTKGIEPKKDDVARLNLITKQVSEMAAQHLRIQDSMVPIVTALSLVAAFVCVAIAFFDWFEYLGRWTGFLILPMPGYVLCSFVNEWLFRYRGKAKLDRFRSFIDEFEPQRPPPEFGNGD